MKTFGTFTSSDACREISGAQNRVIYAAPGIADSVAETILKFARLNGADSLVDYVESKYNIKPGETTEDKKFSLFKVECLGSCGTAPVVQINNDYHERLSKEKFNTLLESLK